MNNNQGISWEAVLGVMAVLELLHAVITYFLVAPLRELKREVTALTNAGFEKGIHDLKEAHKRHEEEIAGLQMFRAGSFGEAVKHFMTREDFDRASKTREAQMGEVNTKLDELLVAKGRETESLRLIQKQVDTMFELWNREHMK